MTDEDTVLKYNHLAMICYDKLYWELDEDQKIEVTDLFDEKNT